MDVTALVDRAFRDDQGRAVGSLIRAFGDLGLAEESVQDAYAEALARWGDDPPHNPGGWILTTARNRAIDRLRRAGRLEAKTAQMAVELDRRQHDADGVVLEEMVVDDRLGAVLAVVYLVFNQGYVRSDGRHLTDVELTAEAIRLGRLLNRLMPDEPEVTGLLALMLLVDARRLARTAGSRLVPMEAQDRTRWDPERIAEGCSLVSQALRRGRPGPYQLQAAIQAVHAEAGSAAETDWLQIAALYDTLAVYDPSPVVSLNRAVAVFKAEGPARGLSLLADLADPLGAYHLYHAARGAMLADLGDRAEAAKAYARAAELTDNVVEQRHLADRIAELGG